jgi:hypothetical protein
MWEQHSVAGTKNGASAPFIGSGGEEMVGREGGRRPVK